jgi:hypothetical protein
MVSAVVTEQAQADSQVEDATPETSMGANGDQPQVLESREPYETKEPGTVLPGSSGARRPAHYGLDIQFEDRPDDVDLGRLMESTVWVNRAHPAYRRALASRSIGYHIALSVAMSLAPLAVEAAEQNGFVVAFLSRWGEALDKPPGRKASKR